MHSRNNRGNEPTFKRQTMKSKIHENQKKNNTMSKTQIIHHVNEDFTSEVIETITFRNGMVSSITFSEPQKL